jgi:hypothetical protein
MADKPCRIRCTACGEDALLKREPRYEGFKRVGETLKCASCGHVYEDEEDVPFAAGGRPAVFSEADRPKVLQVFKEDEKGRICRYCKNYIVNPFTQRCSRHRKVVEATDTCAQFDRAEEEKPE